MAAMSKLVTRGGVVLAVMVASVVLWVPSAGADPGYPPPTLPGTTCSTTGSVVIPLLGTETITLTASCDFAPSSLVTITINGASGAAFTIVAPLSGILALILAFLGDPHMTVDGGNSTAISYGTNTIVATGLNPQGGTNTATFVVDVTQAGASLNPNGSGNTGTTTAAKTGTTTSASGTGTTGASTGSGLAMTGADIALLVLAALVLLALGLLMVRYARRRRDQAATTPSV
jgi:hypothetical protein